MITSNSNTHFENLSWLKHCIIVKNIGFMYPESNYKEDAVVKSKQ